MACRVKHLPADLAVLVAEVMAIGVGQPEREWQFHPVRRWRFDLGWPELLVAFEREGIGGPGGMGRHQRLAGFRADCEKYNAAQLFGWIVIRGTAAMLIDGTAVRDLKMALLRRTVAAT